MSKVTFMYVGSGGKSKSIKVSANVTRIDFSNKGIVSIDLSPISQCTRLKALMLYSNKMATIDLGPVDSCRNLQILGLHKNKLRELDLSPLTNLHQLVRLDLEDNQLFSLDLSPLAHHMALQKVELGKNPLTELDISALFTCSTLKEFKVKNRTVLTANRRVASFKVRPLNGLKKKIRWLEQDQVAAQASVTGRTEPIPEADDDTKNTVLGVLKSVPRISMQDLTQYSELPVNETRELVFELVGEDKVTGRFNPATDEFVSAVAAQIAKKMASDGPRYSKCVYCGKPMDKALAIGEEVSCPSCGIVNIG